MRGLRWLPYAGLVASDVVTEACGKRRVARPLLMPARMATTAPMPTVTVALAASAVGDTALLGRSERAFRCSVSAFGVAHGGWIAACPGHRPRPSLATIAPFAALWLVAAKQFGARADRKALLADGLSERP